MSTIIAPSFFLIVWCLHKLKGSLLSWAEIINVFYLVLLVILWIKKYAINLNKHFEDQFEL